MDNRVIRYFSGDMSPEERDSFLNEASDNAGLRSQLVEAGRVDALLGITPRHDDKDAGENSYRTFAAKHVGRRLHRNLAATLLRYAAVAILCIASTLAATYYIDKKTAPQPIVQTLTVPAGQRAHITLPDGSRVWVNAGSTLSYPSSFGSERKVEIKGEALFSVTHDERHPFIVSTGKMDVRVLGTRFSVSNYRHDPLSVALLEGSVVAYRPGSEAEGYRLRPLQQLVETADGYVIRPVDNDPSAWCNGIYSFNNRQLAEIFHQLELYYDVRIIVKRRQILTARCTAKFRQRDGVMEVLRIISKITPFKISHDDSSGVITLY